MTTKGTNARLIAYYLPQFHPIKENNEWWGEGFTEWTNAAKAKPLYRGHYQPHVPADLGFYDLRVAETREAQAQLARQYGIEGFCYYHFWFAGKLLMERPYREMLQLGEPDFPFCLCWANQTWSGIWHGAPNRILMEQTYPGPEDTTAHFEYLLRAFRDRRYMTVDGKPIFLVLRPFDIPEVGRMVALWRELAAKAGLKGLHLVGLKDSHTKWLPGDHGFDAISTSAVPNPRPWVSRRTPIKWLKRRIEAAAGRPTVYQYRDIVETLLPKRVAGIVDYATLIPNWDNTPRSGKNGIVMHGSTPELFRHHVKQVLDYTRQSKPEDRLVFIKSWNEWAEGNHLEPDLRYGHQYLQVLKDEL